jgi:hypothetical protein
VGLWLSIKGILFANVRKRNPKTRFLDRPECSEFIDDFAAASVGVLTL